MVRFHSVTTCDVSLYSLIRHVVMRFLSLRVGVQGREPLTVALKAEVRQFLKSLRHYSHNYYSQMETGVIPKDVSQDAAGCITGLRSTGTFFRRALFSSCCFRYFRRDSSYERLGGTCCIDTGHTFVYETKFFYFLK